PSGASRHLPQQVGEAPARHGSLLRTTAMPAPAPTMGVLGTMEDVSDSGTWLSLGEASRVLGISQGTLRRWADRGQVASFTTPGGHRRFPRAAILGLVPAERVRRPQIADEGGSTERIAGAYRRLNLAGGRPQSMLGALSDTE